MASKRRIRKNSCTGKKKRWETYESAVLSAIILTKKWGKRIDAYKCNFCGKYHLGNKFNTLSYRKPRIRRH